MSADNYYHFALVGTSAQPLNAYRRYQLENTTDTHWLISIAGTARYPEYWPFQNNAPHISALAEIQRPNEGVAFPHTRSRFDNFYYKGTSSWMPMQQDNHYAEWPLEIEFSASDPTHYHLWNDN